MQCLLTHSLTLLRREREIGSLAGCCFLLQGREGGRGEEAS